VLVQSFTMIHPPFFSSHHAVNFGSVPIVRDDNYSLALEDTSHSSLYQGLSAYSIYTTALWTFNPLMNNIVCDSIKVV
jgi:hypothetical protein